jgi:hypothetical protein
MNRQIQRGCQLSACRWATSRIWGDRASFHCDKMSSAIPKLPADRKRSFRVDDLVQAIGLSGISKSTVPKLCKDIDECVGEFLNRPLTGQWPYVWLDAILPPPTRHRNGRFHLSRESPDKSLLVVRTGTRRKLR